MNKTQKTKDKMYLVGFICYNNHYGCECNIDIPNDVKEDFLEKYSFEYDEYCYYDIIIANNENQALQFAYAQQGATEEETAKEIWSEVDLIQEV